jgi:dTDP-4-dehydrorhamnose reductase
MKILVTGANGLLGQKLVNLLLTSEGVEVIATSKGQNRNQKLVDEQFYTLDVTNTQEVLKVFAKTRPTHVIHTAAMTHVDECELNQEECIIANVQAVQNVVDGCETISAHLTHLSTDFIFDGTHGPLTEDESPKPVNFYGQSKLDAENIIMQSKIRWAIARTVLVYGVVPGLSRSNIILWVKDSLENAKHIKVVSDQWRTPTLAEDLAIGCWLLAKNSAEGVYNISGEDFLTPYEMALLVADHFNLDKSFITEADSSTFSQPAKRPPKTGFIIDKARQDLGYNPHSFSEGIKLIGEQIATADS